MSTTMFLSNHGPGRPSSELYDFKRADPEEREQMMKTSLRRRTLLVWFLHDVDDRASEDPAGTMAAAEVGIEVARSTEDRDLISWALSARGSLGRILCKETASKDLETAVSLAEHPHQKADATGRLAGLIMTAGAKAGSIVGIEAGILKIQEAAALSSHLPRLYTDRGYTMIRHDEAFGHLHLSTFREKERKVAAQILEEVLTQGDRIHARKARSNALLNLGALSLNFAEQPSPRVLDEMRFALSDRRRLRKKSVRATLLRWTLELERIRGDGYGLSARKRLLGLRQTLIDMESWEHASRITVGIAALDAEHSIEGGVALLEDSLMMMRAAGLMELAVAILRNELTREKILELAIGAGIGDPRTLRA